MWRDRGPSEAELAALEHALRLALFLLDDVAEHTALFAEEVFSPRTQFVEHATRDKHGRCKLRRGMAEFLSCILPIIFEQTDVLDARVALEIENAFGGEAQKVCNLLIAGFPEMAIVIGIFDEHFMRPDGTHAIVQAVAPTSGLAFDVIQRPRVNDSAGRPSRAGSVWRFRDHLQVGVGAEAARRVGVWRRFRRLVTGHDPGAGDGIFTQFHKHTLRQKENRGREGASTVTHSKLCPRATRNLTEIDRKPLL